MTWILAGLFVGVLVSFVIEIVWFGSALVMLAGALVGGLLGGVVEGARFWHGTRRFHRARKS